jgi:uncharacterized SAM-binding protein YcdF (DUF218 family)
MKSVFIVDYAYGFHANTCDVDYVSRLRSQAALRALERYPDAYIVLGAGMKEVTGDCGPLADMMRDFLLERGVTSNKILRNARGSNTLAETEAAYALVKSHGGGKVVCATSAFHAPRVWLIWLCRYGIAPTMYTSKLKPRRSEYIRESYKIPRDILRAGLRLS